MADLLADRHGEPEQGHRHRRGGRAVMGTVTQRPDGVERWLGPWHLDRLYGWWWRYGLDAEGEVVVRWANR